jgi:hypothetical protein
MIEYPNASDLIGMALATGMTTMGELSTILSIEDAYLMIEIAAINNYNNRPPDPPEGRGR